MLHRIEFTLRYLYSLLYSGTEVFCPICGGRFTRFIALDTGDLLCPRCGSLPRQRRLWTMLQIFLPQDHITDILHFSPSRILQKRLSQRLSWKYTSTDYDWKADTDRHYDITQIPEPADRFNLIICFHILEHIPDDRKAIRELFRVTKPGGLVLIQTPFREGDIYENTAINTPAGRMLHFGQEDHVRIYSVKGLTSRLADTGFTVKAEYYGMDPKMGMKEEIILACRKPKGHSAS